MSPRTILQLASGRSIDLRNPQPQDYADWYWQAEHLAKENRYNGATPGLVYPVAQHIRQGAYAILLETGNRDLAAYFALHDNPEAALKDDTTPKKNAIAEEIADKFGVAADKIVEVYNSISARHDAAVHAAAGLAWPMPPEIAAQVKHWDLRMFVTEWRDLMGNAPHPDAERYAGIEPLDCVIVPDADWRMSMMALLALWHFLLPSLRGAPRAGAQIIPFGGRS